MSSNPPRMALGGRKGIASNSPAGLVPSSTGSRIFTLSDYERKLTETDAYLQLLIAQCKELDSRITQASTEGDKRRLVDIKSKSLILLDSVKHTIFLLQIAKNTSVNPPPCGTPFFPNENQSHAAAASTIVPTETRVEVPKTETSTQSEGSANSKEEQAPTSHIEQPEQYEEDGDDDDEDDGDYFDAEEIPICILNNQDTMEKNENFNRDQCQEPKVTDAQDIDSMYDDEEDDLGSLESHGSVISHLLSQVKIGMDLTKVVLPTFILERRSLLEMYADFFAHPDLFIAIPDYESPEERMIQVVRWYLSAFHAGRKSSVAKKPYNPILGEIFKCWWEVPGLPEGSPVEDGPVPWAHENNLTFVAEQVSHHPPISAFYCEHVGKRIMCSAQIYTKSKFLGLSVGVSNIGYASIYLLDRGEEYIVTFPSAYGRSILTVPWVELGGSVTISCQQTGYYGNIEFLTKPFYGGKKNRITGEVFNPAKKSIMTLSGEWNGVMYAKYANSTTSEVFVDTRAMSTIKKRVQPVAQQEDCESRYVWKEVTKALKFNDVQTATHQKYVVEQRQRDLVEQRNEQNIKWENRIFHPLGDKWNFNYPLTTRITKYQKKQEEKN